MGGHHIIGTCVVCNWWSRQMDLLEMTAVTLRWSGKALDFTGDSIPITSSKRYFCLPTQFSPYLELVWMYVTPTSLGKPSKKKFFGEGKFSQMWVGGWLVPKQRPVVQTPQNPPQITPNAFFNPNFTFRFPKSHKNPGVGGWVHTVAKTFPKTHVFFGRPPIGRKFSRGPDMSPTQPWSPHLSRTFSSHRRVVKCQHPHWLDSS